MATKESKTIDEILYEIADSFELSDESEITISQLLYYVADPFDTHAELKDDEITHINDVLAKKFKEGNNLLDKIYERLRNETKIIKEGVLKNEWQLLEILMDIIIPGKKRECLEEYKEHWKEEKKNKKKYEDNRPFTIGKEITKYEKNQSNKPLWESHSFREGYYFTQRFHGQTQFVMRRLKSKERIINKIKYKITREFLRAEDTIKLMKKSEKFDDFLNKMEKFRGVKYLSEKIRYLYDNAKKSEKIEDIFDKNGVCADDIFGIKRVASTHDFCVLAENRFNESLSNYYNFNKEIDDPSEKYDERIEQKKRQLSIKDKPDVTIQMIFKTVSAEIFESYASKYNRENFERKRANEIDKKIKESKYSKHIKNITEKVERRLSKLEI